jgi:hypothetical protein
MSKQLTLLNETWEVHKATIIPAMIEHADEWLSQWDTAPAHQLSYYGGDGLWTAFGRANPNYDEYIAKYGNEADEEQQLVGLWIYVLADHNTGGQYNDLIVELAHSQVFGY